MSRQRIKPVLSVGAYQECPHCHGLGRIKSIEAQAVSFLRQAHTAAAKGQIGHIEARVPYEVANYLLNQKRNTITQLEILLGLKVTILGQSDLLPGELHLESFKREKDTSDDTKSVPVSHANQIEMALAEAQLESQQADAVTDPVISTEEQANTPEADTGNDPAPAPEDAETPAPAKKRRRRRRKKPAAQPAPASEEAAAASPAAPQETTATVEQQATEPLEQTAAVDQPATPVTATPETTETATADAAATKRRSRRPRKTAAKNSHRDDTNAQPKESDVPPAGMEGAAPPAANITADSAPATQDAVDKDHRPARPARKRPAKKSRTAATARTETPPEVATMGQNHEVKVAAVLTEKPIEDSEPTKKTVRQPRQRAAKSSSPVAPEITAQKTPDAPVDQPAPKRPRRSRKTAVKTTAEDKAGVADKSNKKEVGAKVSEDKVSTTKDVDDQGQTQPTDATAARAPQRRRRTRPTRAAAAEPDTSGATTPEP
jgi:ribonuclease E